MFICTAEKYLVCCLHKKQAYVQELAAPNAEIIPNKTYVSPNQQNKLLKPNEYLCNVQKGISDYFY